MKEKDKIEQIFHENLGNFEQTPPKDSWDYIEKKLHQKDDDKIIPIWWKISAVVSAISALLILGIFIFKDKNANHIDKPISSNTIIAKEKKFEKQDKDSKKLNPQKADNKDVIHSNIEKNAQPKKIKFAKNQSGLKKNTTIKSEKNISLSKKGIVQKTFRSEEIESSKKQEVIKNTENSLVTNQPNASEIKTFNETNNSNLIKDKKSDKAEILGNKSIASQKTENLINTDSLFLAKNNTNEKKKDFEKKKSQHKLTISPNVAPIFASGSSGSALDSKFDGNAKSFQKNMSYGVNVSYALNPKMKFRSGINYLNLDYNTENVLFVAQSASQPTLETLDSSIVFVFLDGNATFYPGVSGINKGAILQKVSYIEVPLEMSYRILDKKLKINTILGLSGYFLNNNKLYLISDSQNIELGKYNNFNSIHYSGNAGLGFEYEVFKNLNFNLEPVFKYNFNTFKNNNNSFNPYFIGIYSGFIFKF